MYPPRWAFCFPTTQPPSAEILAAIRRYVGVIIRVPEPYKRREGFDGPWCPVRAVLIDAVAAVYQSEGRAPRPVVRLVFARTKARGEMLRWPLFLKEISRYWRHIEVKPPYCHEDEA